MAQKALFNRIRYSPTYSGVGYIAGTSPGLVTVNGAPASRMIYLFDSRTKMLIDSRKSAADGTYKFVCLDPSRTYDVIAEDWGAVYNSVIRARITPAT